MTAGWRCRAKRAVSFGDAVRSDTGRWSIASQLDRSEGEGGVELRIKNSLSCRSKVFKAEFVKGGRVRLR